MRRVPAIAVAGRVAAARYDETAARCEAAVPFASFMLWARAF